MIELSGLQKYTHGGITRLEANIKITDTDAKLPADTMYFEIDENYGGMLVDDAYDPFVLVALYLAMYNHTDLKICGNVSKKLYKNLTWYVQKILYNYWRQLSPVNFTVDGFTEPTNERGKIIGTGISCGVDSLSTIYDRFVYEDDPDYKINTLFFFNCGTNGDFQDSNELPVFLSRGLRSINFANELNLSVIPLDSNLHTFRNDYTFSSLIHLSIYSCVLALQNAIRRYYIGSGCSYDEIKSNGVKYPNPDLAAFCESFFLPLIQTERTELIVDGCQYRRVDKIRKIADWELAQKYLNVCGVYFLESNSTPNCSTCKKCLRTLLPLEILGKLDDFADVFDIERYKKESLNYKAKCVAHVDKDPFYREIVDLAAEYNFPMPTRRDCYTLGRNVVIFGDE